MAIGNKKASTLGAKRQLVSQSIRKSRIYLSLIETDI
jgi:hypothetical protein